MTIIYALKCEQNKYYIGKTNKTANDRFKEHVSSHIDGNQLGSSWTAKYKPICILESHVQKTLFDEDNLTKSYMIKYGIDNVRGGSYAQIELPSYKKKALNDEIGTINNTCFKCGANDHFAKDCLQNNGKNASKNICYNIWLMFVCMYDTIKMFFKKNKKNEINKIRCIRCGRYGHRENDCFAKTNYKGETINDSDEEEACMFIE